MAKLDQTTMTVTLRVRKAWWFGIAYGVGMCASVLRLLSDESADRYVHWMVDKGIRVVVE